MKKKTKYVKFRLLHDFSIIHSELLLRMTRGTILYVLMERDARGNMHSIVEKVVLKSR